MSMRTFVLLAAVVALQLALPRGAIAATLADRARESGCTSKPVQTPSGLYKCQSASGGDAYFNIGDGGSGGSPSGSAPSSPSKSTASPSSFPRVDSDTQKSRDDMRRKVLNDELDAEEKQLADARAEYGSGAPAPLPEEKADAERYRQRIERLRQSVQLHERNIDALKKELAR